jgi:predicted amino acid racemase
MAQIVLYKEKLRKNFNFLNKMFLEKEIAWAVVAKLLCGNELFLKELLKLKVPEVCDARISNLKKIKEIAPEVETVYIKPPAKSAINEVVKYADASFNTELQTIKWLSEEAVKQKKIHKVIIMIEMGDLREGVMGEDLIDFYSSIFKLPNISVTGLGTNLNCMSGVLPSEDKLIQLSLYKQLIEVTFKRKIPWLTGGTSIVIPLLFNQQIPKGINHFRIGETLFFGKNLFTDEIIEGMESSIFKLFSEIIEITEKPIIPTGVLAENPSGEITTFSEEDYGKTQTRAIIDFGVLDISNLEFLIPDDKDIDFVGGSSDMLILDISNSSKNYKIGDKITFDLKYMGALRLLSSDYIEKVVE